MIAILKFKLPEEQAEHRDALQGMACKGVLQEFDNYLRSTLKYGDDLLETNREALEIVRSKLHEIAKDSNIDIWE